MNLDLTDEQRLIRETARDFADAEIVPRARDNDRNERFDLDLVKRIGEMGYLGAPVAEHYGGRSLDYVSYGLIVEEIGRADSSARTVVSVQTSLVAGSIEQWGTEEQKQELLPKLCSGEWLGCFALTEPGTGSDAASVATRATRKNGGWVISGSKMFISMGSHARIALVFAQTDPAKKHRGMGCFVVPTDSSGFTSQQIHGKLGLRASDTAELALDEVRWARMRCWERKVRDSRSRCQRSIAAVTASRPAAWASRRVASTSRSSTRRSAVSSTARSRAFNSCRS